ncbi:MAG TPA: cyclopropane fatty acyl phospholipid synthase [Kofleriaceae bacterium]
MTAARARERTEALLVESGVRVDGDEPWDPIIKHPRVFPRLVRDGTLGLGESYVDGDWDCEALDELATRVLRAGIDRHVGPGWREIADSVVGRFVDRQAIAPASWNASRHYDLGDDLYAAMLGPTMVYSCGYWRTAETLDDAQRAKIDLACTKLELGRGHSLLDIGCGWGELARHAAAQYGAKVVGVTVSRNQAEHAHARCAKLSVDVRLQDWRRVRARFDRVVSIGMFEHVGPRNYRRFFRHVRDLLAPDGLFVLQTIGGLRETATIDAWIDHHVFPGAVLPTAAQITAAIDGLFVIEDWHNLGAYYDRTLMAWHDNFERAWPSLKHYGERFRRKWRYYLLTCAGAFRARRNQLWQIVLSPEGHRGGYQRPLR